MQPGVFALSGWDLVGALTLPGESVKSLIAEGDTRWINRGAYDLLGKHSGVTKSSSDLPRAQALYGPLPEQLKRPDSFASELRKMLRVRAQYRINESEQVELPAVQARGLVVMVHRLPAGAGTQVTAVNFGRDGRPGGRDARDRAAGRGGHRPPRGEERSASWARVGGCRSRSARTRGRSCSSSSPRREETRDDRRRPATAP